MLTLSNPNNVDFSDRKRLFEIIGDIVWQSGSQENVTANLTELRNAAIKSGAKAEFEEVLEAAKQALSKDPDFRESGLVPRFRYTVEDFAHSEEPFLEVFNQPTAFMQKRALEAMSIEAKKVGFNGFKAMYKAFTESMRAINERPAGSLALNPTDFPNQPLELEAGEWNCDVTGVSRTTINSCEYACHHPIMPVERLTNIDTFEEKLKIAYYRDRHWREIIVGKGELFDASKILKLASVGVSVTSKSAKLLSEFLCDMEVQNDDILPKSESVSRLGYIGDGSRFSPYVDGLIFDGDANYSNIYSAICERGNYDTWLETALKCRSESLTAQIMLAASFASILIGKIGALSFFVHLWGVESGTGKTVALMLAASVWGNPAVGHYIQTFNATQVGHEKTAAFLNNIPMCIDELQLSKDSHGRSKFDVYQLSQGVGRTRGNKGGGIDKTPTWALCLLTTGESPLTSDSSGAGAVNRVIDIECRASEAVIKDGISVSRAIKQNYGFAGRKFIEAMTEQLYSEAQQNYERYFKELSSGATTEKQAMAAAMLLTADELADRFIFKTGRHLTVAQISEFLKSKASVSAGERGYAYMCDWVGVNSNKFLSRDDGNTGEIYGKITVDGWAYVNSTVFRNAAKAQGYDDRALLSWLKTKGLIQTKKSGAYAIYTSAHNVKAQYIVMKLPEEEIPLLDEFELL